jgi:hypothetical protein
MQQAGFCAVSCGRFSWQDVTTRPLSVQPTDNRSKPLLPNHHNWSWYIQWKILDGLEGDSSAGWDVTGWFLCCGPWKIQLTRCHDQAIIRATNWQQI